MNWISWEGEGTESLLWMRIKPMWTTFPVRASNVDTAEPCHPLCHQVTRGEMNLRKQTVREATLQLRSSVGIYATQGALPRSCALCLLLFPSFHFGFFPFSCLWFHFTYETRLKVWVIRWQLITISTKLLSTPGETHGSGNNSCILQNYDGDLLAMPGSLFACFFRNILQKTLKDAKVQWP